MTRHTEQHIRQLRDWTCLLPTTPSALDETLLGRTWPTACSSIPAMASLGMHMSGCSSFFPTCSSCPSWLSCLCCCGCTWIYYAKYAMLLTHFHSHTHTHSHLSVAKVLLLDLILSSLCRKSVVSLGYVCHLLIRLWSNQLVS